MFMLDDRENRFSCKKNVKGRDQENLRPHIEKLCRVDGSLAVRGRRHSEDMRLGWEHKKNNNDIHNINDNKQHQ